MKKKLILGKTSQHKSLIHRVWLASALINYNGEKSEPSSPSTLMLNGIHVHLDYPMEVKSRLQLISYVPQNTLSKDIKYESLWVYPGGFFQCINKQEYQNLFNKVENYLVTYPPGSTIVFGVDQNSDQYAWIIQINRNSRIEYLKEIKRGNTAINDRIIEIGELKVSVFVCGEFTGSRTSNNGPFYKFFLLSDVCNQLEGVNLLVNLAHWEVSKSLNEKYHKRYVHQNQLSKFSCQGAGILVQHHRGKQRENRPHFKHASNWIIFKGGRWLSDDEVTTIYIQQ
jgi:hypothetical protein